MSSLLIYGTDPKAKGVSQSALTVSQLIVYEFKKAKTETSSNHFRYVKHCETLVPNYAGKLYTVAYPMIGVSADVTKLQFRYYDNEKVLVINLMRKNAFTGIPKENIDVNANQPRCLHIAMASVLHYTVSDHPLEWSSSGKKHMTYKRTPRGN